VKPAFYARPTLDVTADLIGKVLVHDGRGRRTAGIIVEVEAYIGEDDPACHAAPGPTKRNAPLYGPPGRAYVYLNYGLHYLVNAVTEPAGSPAAVLIRALEPLEGVELMARRRGKNVGCFSRGDRAGKTPDVFGDLCRGPGNLTVAMAIDLRQNGADLWKGKLRIEDRGITPPALEWSRRIGIRVGVEQPWRCTWRGHAAISGGRYRRRDSRR
jgi:DNA-3-methyladenine glycosylase